MTRATNISEAASKKEGCRGRRRMQLDPLTERQANAQMVDWAKANKQLLVLNREVVVWGVG